MNELAIQLTKLLEISGQVTYQGQIFTQQQISSISTAPDKNQVAGLMVAAFTQDEKFRVKEGLKLAGISFEESLQLDDQLQQSLNELREDQLRSIIAQINLQRNPGLIVPKEIRVEFAQDVTEKVKKRTAKRSEEQKVVNNDAETHTDGLVSHNEKINEDTKGKEENSEEAGLLKSIFNYLTSWIPKLPEAPKNRKETKQSNFMFAYLAGQIPTHHEVPQNYKENQHLMSLLTLMMSSGSPSKKADQVRESLANEAYLQTLALLEIISELYPSDSTSVKNKQIIAKAIFSDKSKDFDHNFFHLLGVPMVQRKEAASNYKLLLNGTRDFLLRSGLPIKEALGQDKEGNNPLHILAAVSPLNQFQAFLEIFGDLIPQDILEQKNNYGHSPLDILRSDDVQKEAINYVSKVMKDNFIIHTSSTSPSDVLHKPDSLEVMRGKESVLVKLKGQETFFPSYPKSAYSKKPDGDYEIRDLLNGEVVDTLPAEEYDKIKEILPEGTSYALLAFESRKQKLQLVTEKKLEAPKPHVEKAAASSLSQKTKSVKAEL